MMNESEESTAGQDEDTEIDRRAMDLIARLQKVRTLGEEVLRRWRAGETMSYQVQRRIFQAAARLQQSCRTLNKELAGKNPG